MDSIQRAQSRTESFSHTEAILVPGLRGKTKGTEIFRLQQPVQNSISNSTNVLWNSPSFGKNYSYRLTLLFIKPPLFCLLKEKNRVKLIYFFRYSPLFGMGKKQPKNQWNCIVLNFNQIKASLFHYKFKSSFPTKST